MVISKKRYLELLDALVEERELFNKLSKKIEDLESKISDMTNQINFVSNNRSAIMSSTQLKHYLNGPDKKPAGGEK